MARDIARNRIADAYAEYDRMKADEYKNPNAGKGDPPDTGTHELQGSKPGQPCTRNGFAGVLKRGPDGELFCQIPRGRDSRPAMAAYARRQEEKPDEEEKEPEEEAGEERTVRRDVPDQQKLQKMLDQKNKAMDAFHATESEQFRKALRGE